MGLSGFATRRQRRVPSWRVGPNATEYSEKQPETSAIHHVLIWLEALREGDGLGAQLPMRLAPFTLPLLLADALAGVPQLGDQTGFLIFGEGPGDLAHHFPRRVVACG